MPANPSFQRTRLTPLGNWTVSFAGIWFRNLSGLSSPLPLSHTVGRHHGENALMFLESQTTIGAEGLSIFAPGERQAARVEVLAIDRGALVSWVAGSRIPSTIHATKLHHPETLQGRLTDSLI